MIDKRTDLPSLIVWLRTQPPDREYIWSDPVYCMMGHYLRDNGSRWGEVAFSDMPYYEEIAKVKPWTFGAALGRAEALKALPPPALQITQEPMKDAVRPQLQDQTPGHAG